MVRSDDNKGRSLVYCLNVFVFVIDVLLLLKVIIFCALDFGLIYA